MSILRYWAKPWLLSDVDGVLAPFGHGARGSTLTAQAPGRGGIRITQDAPAILAAAREHFRIAYCTSWAEDANTALASVLGIGKLPVVPLSYARDVEQAKSEGAAAWAAKYPRARVIWWDDKAVPGRTPGVTVIPVESGTGLLWDHLAQAKAAAGLP